MRDTSSRSNGGPASMAPGIACAALLSSTPSVAAVADAAIRVRGSIIDSLRRNSNLCRTTIAMQQKVRAAEKVLEGELQRTPTNAEIAEKMAMPQE